MSVAEPAHHANGWREAALAAQTARLINEARAAAVAEERRRISRELHDSVSQALYGIVMGARTARQVLERGEAGNALQPIDYVLELAESGLAEMREAIFGLRSRTDSESLPDSLRKLATAAATHHGLQVRIVAEEPEQLPRAAADALRGVAREALNNAVKHAGAHEVRIILRSDASGVALTLADDGCGFDPTAQYPGHLGLKSMSERAAALGGWVAIESAPGAGTTVSAWLPLSA